ncbi:MAG: hypothetical protein Q9220_007755 [cf. Caloplaca sp. 1 TL-2023]
MNPAEEPTKAHVMITRGRSTASSAPSPFASGAATPLLPPVAPTRKSRSPPKLSAASPKKVSSSPTKSVITFATSSGGSRGGITKKEQLAQLRPMVSFYGIEHIKNESIPQMAVELWTKYIMLAKAEDRVIPEELKASRRWN